MNSYKFPRYLSSPLQILWFESDEISIIAICYAVSLLFGWVGWFMMLLAPYYYSRAKKNNPRGFLRHLLYFIGYLKLKGYPIYQEKYFVE